MMSAVVRGNETLPSPRRECPRAKTSPLATSVTVPMAATVMSPRTSWMLIALPASRLVDSSDWTVPPVCIGKKFNGLSLRRGPSRSIVLLLTPDSNRGVATGTAAVKPPVGHVPNGIVSGSSNKPRIALMGVTRARW